MFRRAAEISASPKTKALHFVLRLHNESHPSTIFFFVYFWCQGTFGGFVQAVKSAAGLSKLSSEFEAKVSNLTETSLEILAGTRF